MGHFALPPGGEQHPPPLGSQ